LDYLSCAVVYEGEVGMLQFIVNSIYGCLIAAVMWIAVYLYNVPFFVMFISYFVFLIIDTLRDLIIADIRASKL
jgi:hypothetical protein